MARPLWKPTRIKTRDQEAGLRSRQYHLTQQRIKILCQCCHRRKGFYIFRDQAVCANGNSDQCSHSPTKLEWWIEDHPSKLHAPNNTNDLWGLEKGLMKQDRVLMPGGPEDPVACPRCKRMVFHLYMDKVRCKGCRWEHEFLGFIRCYWLLKPEELIGARVERRLRQTYRFDKPERVVVRHFGVDERTVVYPFKPGIGSEDVVFPSHSTIAKWRRWVRELGAQAIEGMRALEHFGLSGAGLGRGKAGYARTPDGSIYMRGLGHVNPSGADKRDDTGLVK